MPQTVRIAAADRHRIAPGFYARRGVGAALCTKPLYSAVFDGAAERTDCPLDRVADRPRHRQRSTLNRL
jgi:hypothetical protein